MRILSFVVRSGRFATNFFFQLGLHIGLNLLGQVVGFLRLLRIIQGFPEGRIEQFVPLMP